MQPIAVFFILFYFFLGKMGKGYLKITQVDFALFAYFLFSCFFLFKNFSGVESTYIAIREVFLIYILIFIFNLVEISYKQWEYILKFIFLLTILNIIFVFLIFFIGWEEYTKLLVGETFWGIHPEYKFKFSDFFRKSYFELYRVPALIGESAAVGHFGLISFFLLKDHKKFKILAYLSLILVVFCFTRSVYVVIILYFFLLGLTTNKRFARLVLYSLPCFPILAFALFKFNLLDITSLLMRFDFWSELMNVKFNPVYGGAIGTVGLASEADGFETVIDNYWIFLLFSIGIIGLVLCLLFFYEKTKNKSDLVIITISFFISGLFITLTQSLVFVSLFPLLFMNYKYLEKQNGKINPIE